MSDETRVATLSAEQISLIKATVARGATDDELALFLHQCRRTGLDPLARQIYAVKRWDADLGREALAVQTGIDGYWLIADRTGLCAGNAETIFGDGFEAEPGVEAPVWARVTVYKVVAGQRVPYTATCRFSEFAARKKDGKLTRFWREKPFHMLSKCAEAGALRKAFPQELSGVYTREEMPELEHEPTPRQAALPAPEPAPATPAAPPEPTITPPEAEDVASYLDSLGISQADYCAKLTSALKREIPGLTSLPRKHLPMVQKQLAEFRDLDRLYRKRGQPVPALLDLEPKQRAYLLKELSAKQPA